MPKTKRVEMKAWVLWVDKSRTPVEYVGPAWSKRGLISEVERITGSRWAEVKKAGFHALPATVDVEVPDE